MKNRQLLIQRVFILAPLAFLLVMGFQRRWVTEDAFITFRVVNNLLEGHGPVFNIGERVEAYTHPLWLALLALWTFLGARIELGAVALGLVFSAIGLIAGQAGAANLWRSPKEIDVNQQGPRMILFPAGALVFAVIPVVWDFATSGLETGMTFGWLGVSFWMLVRLSRPSLQVNEESHQVSLSQVFTAGALIGIGPLIRPDLGVFAILMLLLLFGSMIRKGIARWPKVMACIAIWLLLPLSYQVFRMGYFASLVPNTALVKEAGSANWTQGVLYFLDFTNTYRLWIPAALLAVSYVPLVSRLRQQDRLAVSLAVVPVLGAIIHTLWVIRVGGDFMHGRLLLPGLFSALLPVMAVDLNSGRPWKWSKVAAVGVTGWCFVCAGLLRTSYLGYKSVNGIVNEREFYVYSSSRNNPMWIEDYAGFYWHEDGRLLGEIAGQYDGDLERPLFVEFSSYHKGAGETAALAKHIDGHIALAARLYAVGMSGYVAGSRVWIVDRMGLADPIGSRMQLARRGRPGHEKNLPKEWTVARLGEPSPDESPEVAAAREALKCGELHELLQAIEEPMSGRRFVSNVGVAFRLHDLRIPPDPVAAKELFCEE